MIPSVESIIHATRAVTGLDPIGGGGTMSRRYARRVAVYSLNVIAGMDLKAVSATLGRSIHATRHDRRMAENDAGVLAAVGRVRRIVDKHNA